MNNLIIGYMLGQAQGSGITLHTPGWYLWACLAMTAAVAGGVYLLYRIYAHD